MHQQFLNTTKQLFKCGINGTKSNNWSLELDYFSPLMDQIKLPRCLSRFCTKLVYYEHFKAIDWKYFTLYLFVPLFKQSKIPKTYFALWLHFIRINLYICAFELPISKLEDLEFECEKFAKEFTSLFGEESVTLNIHLQLHIREDVKRFGLMFSHAEWTAESKLGDVKRDKHGTHIYPRENLLSYLESLHRPNFFQIETPKPTGSKIWRNYYSSEKTTVLEAQKLSELNETLTKHHIIEQKLSWALKYSLIHRGIYTFETASRAQYYSCDDSGITWRTHPSETHFGLIEAIFVTNNESDNYTMIIEVTQFTGSRENLLHFTIFPENPKKRVFLDASKTEFYKVFTCKQKKFRYFALLLENVKFS